ncbi:MULTISPECIES: DUF3613 domain-containing protein [Paraburkholderia]|uniref:DUF3613 domain-containing protein n=1 Tax=Paraburkholderia TaxID=1822464 RepID=UPI0022510528|nr:MULTISPECIES: DUF3613 domain-containing protein [Paraburkholderia]MCX4156754.1 DUF3613 domain-containing protein [Paraburkholderia aspalathi]MDN7166159.1 DUF3613 domain-containing protein [Paraburkholderia sp. SECH2]MDQ6394645.1 DUF3613 domain-containing protein [Paraburkholderia aspalathi]
MKSKQMERGCMGSVARIVMGAGLAFGLTAGLADVALAQTGTSTETAPAASEIGHSARAWINLQSSNAEAAPALPMLGAEAGLAYRRYLESFKSKIPDLYESALGSGGNGSSGSQFGSGSSGSSGER